MTVPKTSAPSPSTLASTPCASNVGEGKAEPVAPSPEPASSSSARSPSLNECSLATVCTRAQHIPPEELSASRLAARGLYDSYLARIRPPRPATNGKRRSAHSGTNQRDTEASLSSVSAKDDASISGKSSPTTTTSAESCTSKDTPKGSSAEGTELCPSVKGPATPRTRERLRLRYAEKAREKTAEMYRKAIVLAHEREQTEGQRHRAKRVVEFRIHYSTSFGQDVLLVGNVPQLGSWSVGSAIPLEWTPGNVWIGRVTLSTEDGIVEYKYIVRNAQQRHTLWEPGDNHKLDLARAKTPVDVVQDHWGSGGG